MKRRECSARKIKVWRSEIPGNRLPVQHSFIWIWWHIFLFALCEVHKGPRTVDIAHWCILGAHFCLSSAAEWMLGIALTQHLGVSKGLSGTRENTWWLLTEALSNGLSQLDSFLSRVPFISTSNCASSWHWQCDGVQDWCIPSLDVRMKWDGRIFFSDVERIFVQGGGTQTPWVSGIWERNIWNLKGKFEFEYLEGGSNCSFLGVCQQAWCRRILSWVAARALSMPRGQVSASLQSFWQGCFGSLLCLQGPAMPGSLQALGWGN